MTKNRMFLYLASRAWACAVILTGSLIVSPLVAAPDADRLLPATTKGYLSVPDVAEFRRRWQSTQLGQLSVDPIMKPFADDLRQQIRDKFMKSSFNFSVTWDELADVCSGELCLAAIQPENDEKQHAAVLIVDVSEKQNDAQRLLEKLAQDLADRTEDRATQTVGDAELVISKLTRKRGESTEQFVIRCLTNERLIIGNHLEIVIDVVKRLQSGDEASSLQALPAYQRVMERVASEGQVLTPQIRWFIDPFGYAQVVRAARGGAKKRGKPMLEILQRQGFDAVVGIGGWIHLANEDHDLLHRTFAYAPGNTESESGEQLEGPARFRLAGRMLDFPNDQQWNWPDWVPRDLASACSFRWDVVEAFEHSKTLVDEIAGSENFFEDLLSSIKNDPNGPQIDVRDDFVAHLGQHVTMMTDHVFPISPQSERVLFAIRVSDEEAVRETVHKALVTDPDARQLDVNGHTVWEIIDEEDPVADLDLDSITSIDPLGGSPELSEEKEEEAKLPNSAITVAQGHFFVATHVDFLRRILQERPEEDRIDEAEDFRLVLEQLGRIGANEDCARTFARTDEAYRPTYELIKQGRMPESESMLGKLLNRILGPDEEDVLREQTIDGSQLPDFEAVRRYLGPSGNYVRTEADGWFASGVLLNKQMLYADGIPAGTTKSLLNTAADIPLSQPTN